jgi:hypothetical protein
MLYLHSGIVLIIKNEWNHNICSDIDETGLSYAMWNKPDTEKQIPHVHTHLWKPISQHYRIG